MRPIAIIALGSIIVLGLSGCGSPDRSAAGASSAATTKGQRASAPRIQGPIPRELIERNDADGVRDAIARGADVDATYDKYDTSALHLATSYRAAGALSVLIDSGAAIDATTTAGWTALINCCVVNEPALAELLLDAGADPNHRDKAGETALTYAAQMGFDALAEVLVRGGADVNVRTPSGDTPLHKAADNRNRSAATIEVLLRNGADPTARNKRGQTPRDVAHEDLATLLP